MSDYTIDEVKCDKCPLWETSTSGAIRRAGFYGRGTGKLGLWLYGEACGHKKLRMECLLLVKPEIFYLGF